MLLAVVLLIMPKQDRRMFLLEAYKLGMTHGDYVFYTVEMVPDENVLNPEDVWASNDGQNDMARQAFEAVFHVRLGMHDEIFHFKIFKNFSEILKDFKTPPLTYFMKYLIFIIN